MFTFLFSTLHMQCGKCYLCTLCYVLGDMFLIAHLNDLGIYHWLFGLIISLSIIPTARRLLQWTSLVGFSAFYISVLNRKGEGGGVVKKITLYVSTNVVSL